LYCHRLLRLSEELANFHCNITQEGFKKYGFANLNPNSVIEAFQNRRVLIMSNVPMYEIVYRRSTF